MMGYKYIYEYGETYIVIKPTSGDDTTIFEENIILGAGMENAVGFDIRSHEGNKEYYYCVTGMTSMAEKESSPGMGYGEVKHFYLGLIKIIEEMHDHLLYGNNVITDPKMIFFKGDSQDPQFICVPGNDQKFQKSIENITDHILKKVDYNDHKVLQLIYRISHITGRERWSINDIKPELEDRPYEERSEYDENIEESDDKEDDAYQSSKRIGFDISKTGFLLGAAAAFGLTTIPFIRRQLESLSEMLNVKYSVIVLAFCVIGLIIGYTFSKIKDREKDDFWEDRDEELIPALNKVLDARNTTALNYEEPQNTIFMSQVNRSISTVLVDKENSDNNIIINRFPAVLGKSPERADYIVNSRFVSRSHVRLEVEGELIKVTDLGSANGTRINGEPVMPGDPVKAKDKDRITIADRTFELWIRKDSN